jgi:3-oxoacyl-[acyl-carrier protein] reductase
MAMVFNFTDRHVLVTGGSAGIGASLVSAFADAGAKVAFTYRSNAESAAAMVARWTNENGVAAVYALHADLVSADDAASCVDRAATLLGGKIDIGAVANAS